MNSYRIVQGERTYQLEADDYVIGSALEFFVSGERVAMFTWFDSFLLLPADD